MNFFRRSFPLIACAQSAYFASAIKMISALCQSVFLIKVAFSSPSIAKKGKSFESLRLADGSLT